VILKFVYFSTPKSYISSSVCRILKRASEFGKIEENIFSVKFKWKSLRAERSPRAEETVSASHSSGSSIIDTEDSQFLLCIHAQFQQSALVLPSSRCDRRKSVPMLQSFSWTWQKKF
jgi:hypothetical protein